MLAITLVGRVVILAAHYLKFALPFPLVYEKGVCWTEHKGAPVPIQRKLRNLYINIRALCLCQGVPLNVLAKVDFIEGLWQLFHSPSLGKPISQALFEGEARENKLVTRKAGEGNQTSTNNQGNKSKSKTAKKREEDEDFVLVMM
jgi:hypothetical protein